MFVKENTFCLGQVLMPFSEAVQAAGRALLGQGRPQQGPLREPGLPCLDRAVLQRLCLSPPLPLAGLLLLMPSQL